MSKKRVLITGAAGFLGSHLCDRFIKEGYHVIGMDNLITGDLKNIEHLFKLEAFELILINFVNVLKEVNQVVEKEGVK
jgi:dTDP-glucose 4,6-dehydratase